MAVTFGIQFTGNRRFVQHQVRYYWGYHQLIAQPSKYCMLVLCVAREHRGIRVYLRSYQVEGGAFLLLDRVKLCGRNKGCEVCDSIREQCKQEDVQDVLTPPKEKKKRGRCEPAPRPHRFKLPLQKPLCDNTTKFSKFINKRLPGLKGKVLQCAAHINGIAWQKRLHCKYFKNQVTYKRF
jgi:hypothetical protein